MKMVLVLSLVALAWMLVDSRIDKAHTEGFKLGMHYALKKDPPSEELELVCAGLWIGEQNKKIWSKENKK